MLVSDRVAPWIGTAKTVNADAMSPADMAQAAGMLGWNIRLEPTPSVGRTSLVNFDVVIDNPNDGLVDTIGRVGKVYTPYPNESLVELVTDILPNGAFVSAAGTLRDNAYVFMAAKLDSDMYLGGGDKIERWFIVTNGHDGRSPVTGHIGPLRFNCTNSFTLSFKNALRSFSVRHGKDVIDIARERARVLELTENYFKAFDHEMSLLLDTEVLASEVNDIFLKAYPAPDADAKNAFTRHENRLDALHGIYNADHNANIYGTAFGVFNAMEEYVDWHRTSKGNEETLMAANAGFYGTAEAEKQRLFELVR